MVDILEAHGGGKQQLSEQPDGQQPPQRQLFVPGFPLFLPEKQCHDGSNKRRDIEPVLQPLEIVEAPAVMHVLEHI